MDNQNPQAQTVDHAVTTPTLPTQKPLVTGQTALIFSVIGLVFPPMLLIGLITGLIALKVDATGRNLAKVAVAVAGGILALGIVFATLIVVTMAMQG